MCRCDFPFLTVFSIPSFGCFHYLVTKLWWIPTGDILFYMYWFLYGFWSLYWFQKEIFESVYWRDSNSCSRGLYSVSPLYTAEPVCPDFALIPRVPVTGPHSEPLSVMYNFISGQEPHKTTSGVLHLLQKGFRDVWMLLKTDASSFCGTGIRVPRASTVPYKDHFIGLINNIPGK